MPVHFGRADRDCVIDVCRLSFPPVFCVQKRLELPVLAAAQHGKLPTAVPANANYVLSPDSVQFDPTNDIYYQREQTFANFLSTKLGDGHDTFASSSVISPTTCASAL